MMVHIPTNQEAIEWAARNREEQRRRHGPEPHEKAAETIASLRDALEQAQKERDEAIALNEKALGAGGVLRLLAQRDAAQKDAKDARALLGDISDSGALWHAPILRARIEAMLEKKT